VVAGPVHGRQRHWSNPRWGRLGLAVRVVCQNGECSLDLFGEACSADILVGLQRGAQVALRLARVSGEPRYFRSQFPAHQAQSLMPHSGQTNVSANACRFRCAWSGMCWTRSEPSGARRACVRLPGHSSTCRSEPCIGGQRPGMEPNREPSPCEAQPLAVDGGVGQSQRFRSGQSRT